MLSQAAEGVWVHESEFVQSNAVVVQGRSGVLLIDPGVTGAEIECLAKDLREMDQPVVVGFSTHPDWDHVLWHPLLGSAPRYGTAVCAAALRDELEDPAAKTRIEEHLPPEIAGQVPLDLLGQVVGLAEGATRLPWDGPEIRVLEHRAHAPGHAALLIEERGVLVAGDMLSDVLVPMLDLDSPGDPIEDYLAALRLFHGVADTIDVVIPGHGSVGGADQLRARLFQDRAYAHALRDARVPDDPRIGTSARPGWKWVSDVHDGQVQRLAESGVRMTDMTTTNRPKQLRLIIETDDFDEALRFYRDVLDMPEQPAYATEGDDRVAILHAGVASIELATPTHVRNIDEVENAPSHDGPTLRIALEVDDTAQVAERAERAGAARIAPATRTPFHTINARVQAPSGWQVTFFQELESLEQRGTRPGFSTDDQRA